MKNKTQLRTRKYYLHRRIKPHYRLIVGKKTLFLTAEQWGGGEWCL